MDYRSKVIILTLDGRHITLNEWQKLYGLPIGSDLVGKYFSYKETRFIEDITLYGVVIIAEPLIIVLDEYRHITGVPAILSSLNRNDAKQLELLKLEEEENARRKKLDPSYKPDKLRAEISPHVFKLAADVDVKNKAQVLARVPAMRLAARNKNIRIRIGYMAYLKKHDELAAEGKPDQWTFIHVDVCPMYFGPGGVWHKDPHPKVWEIQNEW